MKKYFSLIIGLSVLLAACGGATTTPAASSGQPASSGSTTVSMTGNGFSPSELTITAGTEVTFVNNDTAVHWPASGVHPTHLLCAGFDALAPVPTGGSYKFTFNEAKACPMHDHLNPGIKGKIIVQ